MVVSWATGVQNDVEMQMANATKKLAAFQELTKVKNISTGRHFAASFNKARLLIDNPHAYREWKIIGQSSVPGFYHLQSSFRISANELVPVYSTFNLCLHESEFERIQ